MKFNWSSSDTQRFKILTTILPVSECMGLRIGQDWMFKRVRELKQLRLLLENAACNSSNTARNRDRNRPPPADRGEWSIHELGHGKPRLRIACSKSWSNTGPGSLSRPLTGSIDYAWIHDVTNHEANCAVCKHGRHRSINPAWVKLKLDRLRCSNTVIALRTE